MPDIDIDFDYVRRGEVIDYVTGKYGADNVCQIITFGTMKARAVVRDVGRVLKIPYGEVDRIAKMIPETLGMTLEKAMELGNPILGNLMLIGAAAGIGVLPLERNDFEAVITEAMPPDKLELNLSSYDLGVQMIGNG